MGPIQIQAQALRQWKAAPPAGGAAFAIVPDDIAGTAAGGDGVARKASWRQSDVRRAIAAAEQAGLSVYRVEIAPDGTISIVVGTPSDLLENAAASDRLDPR
jgi:hypothetical protein